MPATIGPENGLPTEMPLEPPYIDPETDWDASAVFYDYEQLGDIIHPSDPEWRRWQKIALIGSSSVAALSFVNLAATNYLVKTTPDTSVEYVTNAATLCNLGLATAALFASGLSMISIVKVKSIAKASEKISSSV